MKKYLVLVCLFYFLLSSFVVLNGELFSIPKNWLSPVYDFSKNPLTKDKIELGRHLFYDPILSRNNTISCANCHLQYTAFSHVDHALSHGIDDKIGTRNSPALVNLAWNKSFMWDGAINHLDMQALAPISHPKEMDEKIEHVLKKLQETKKYPKLFLKAFGDSVITGEYTLKAISQFMLTLISANSKYDRVANKLETFTEQEEKGYALFKQHCNSCHTEPLFTNNTFQNNGLKIDTVLIDLGRFNITKENKDSLKFKVPSLRNIEFSYPYMHDGRFKNLNEVTIHYSSGIVNYKNLGDELKKPINLSPNDRVDLVAFLLTLTDKEFLFNPKYSYPK